jgi:hypothetical protein
VGASFFPFSSPCASCGQIHSSPQKAQNEIEHLALYFKRQLAHMRDVEGRYGAKLIVRNRRDRHGMSIQRRELHLVGGAVLVDMHHRADVTRLQFLIRKIRRQHDAIMFFHHPSTSGGH